MREKRAWWREHREKSPDLFVAELRAVVERLRQGADPHRKLYCSFDGVTVWMLLMPKTRHHVYYRYSASRDEVEVLFVWNASASAPPVL